MNRPGRIWLHEWIAGGVAVFSCLLLLIIVPQSHIPDASRLTLRAVQNVLGLAQIQLITCLGICVGVVVLSRWARMRTYLTVTGPRATVATVVRATLPLLLLIVFHQTVPLWQRVAGFPEADSTLIWLDERIFSGTNPVLWLEQIMTRPLTEYMWAAYLSWFVAFQGTIYLLALLRPAKEWRDMALATVLTLVFGYIGYVLVPAVGPVHAMAARFTISLAGSPIGEVTTGIVDQFGVWRDAFPSIHAAISMLLMIYVWRYLRRWSAPYMVMGVSILISTVYLRWHYVTDVLAGVTLALFSAWLSPYMLARWERRREATLVPEVRAM